MRFVALLSLLMLLVPAFAQDPADAKLAERYFQEARWISDDDGGELWGKPLYGPILFVDPKTRAVYANQSDAQGKLNPLESGTVWMGVLPKDVLIANTATEWAGVKWTMVMWPLPEDPANRMMLMMHECWHRIQDTVGLPPGRSDNSHLDTMNGRIWIRLEWRALSNALISWGPPRKQAITDALVFRAYRRSLFPGSAAAEDRMEVHEGMAEYTGVRMMGISDWGRRSFLSGRLKVNALKPSYPMSFAYETGPCYGLLLDVDDKPWRSTLRTTSSLSEILRGFEKIDLPPDLAKVAKDRANAYDMAGVLVEEEKREHLRNAKETLFRKQLVTGALLVLPLPHGNFSFDPNEVFPLGADGRVFPTSHIADDWGVLEVTDGVRVNSMFNTAFVAAPSSATELKGEGWTLTLNPGWKIVPGTRKGDFTVAKG